MNRIILKSSGIIATLLMITAILKLFNLFGGSAVTIRVDPVVGFLTNRESLILASVFELAVATFLFRYGPTLESALLILYFSACASIYQFGLLVQGNIGCGCLGAATSWFGPVTAMWLARAILVLLWVYGLALLQIVKRKAVLERASSASTAHAILALLLCASTTTSKGSPVSAQGEIAYKFLNEKTGLFREERREAFTVVFDADGLRVGSPPATTSARYGTNMPVAGSMIAFVNKQVIAKVFYGSSESDGLGVSLTGPEYAWELGNCGDTTATWAFLMARCLDIFPTKQSPGTRRLASPSTMIGGPLSLITEAQYAFPQPNAGEVLDCNVIVSGNLKANWMNSSLLSPAFDQQRSQKAEIGSLTLLPDGFLYQSVRFSQFTNIAGIRFPTLAESDLFAPSTNAPTATQGHLYAVFKVSISGVRLSPDEVVSPLPVRGNVIAITDNRLGDRKLHVSGANFKQTNDFTSFEISGSAHSAFEAVAQKAREKARAERLKPMLTNVMVIAFILGPILIIYFSRKSGRKHAGA